MGNATNTMTRFLKSFLRLGVALVVLAGLSAGAAMAQSQYVDPVDGTAGATGNANDPVPTIAEAIGNATPPATIALRIGRAYNEDLDLTSEFTFTSWNGEPAASGGTEQTGPDAPGSAVLNGNLTVGDPGTNTPETLTLAEGLSLEFEQNQVLTLVGEDASALNSGSIVGGQGELLISTASGEFTINITRDDGTSQVRATVQNLTVDKSDGVVEVIRAESSADPTLTAELGIWDGNGAVSPNGFADLDVQSGEVTANRNDIRFVANTGTAGTPADPEPALNVSDEASIQSNGSLFLQVGGELGFETTGDGDLGILLKQVSAPENTGNGDGPAGTTISFSSIGNGGTSVVSADTLNAPSLADINGTLTVEEAGPETFVEAGALESVTSDLRVENGASVVAGGSNELTVGDEIRVQNSSRLEFDASVVVEGGAVVDGGGLGSSTLLLNDEGTFEGSFDIAGQSIATFNSETTFNGDVSVAGDGTTMTFAEPGAKDTSSVNAALTANSGQVILQDGTGSGDGLHNLALNGDITVEDAAGTDPVTDFVLGDDSDGDPTRLFVDGGGAQDFEIADGAGVDFDRLRVQNDLELVDTSTGALTIVEDLFLEDGTFNTNGQLNADGITLTRNRTADDDGELFRGAGDIAYTETGGNPDTPNRIVYTGTENIPTADELLPEGRDDSEQGEPSDLEISEFAVDMDDSDAVVTLNADHTVMNRTEILSGNLSLGSATLALADQSTFVRGDGALDPGPVSPEDALIFPDGVIDLEYINDEAQVTTGIEFPSNDRDLENVDPATLIRDVSINESETGDPNDGVLLSQEIDGDAADTDTLRINGDLNLNNGTLDVNGQTLQHNGGGSVGYNHEAALADTANTEDEGLFQFIGDNSDATVVGNTDDESGTTFPFPTTEVAKDDNSTVTFNVTDNNDSGMEDPNDGYAFNGNFTIAAAQNFDGNGDGDGITQLNDGVTFVDGDDGTDVLSVDGNFAQNAGSFYAGGVSNKFASFEVTGDLTKAASDTSRFEVDFGPAPQEFAVDGNVTQESGTFKVEGATTFTVGGDLQNNSPDALDFNNFTSSAFEVNGTTATEAVYSVGGTLSQSAGLFETSGFSGSAASLSITENYEQDGGTATLAGFSGSEASVTITENYVQEGGQASIPNATLVEVTDVTITDGDLAANLQDNVSTPPNQFVASTLTVGDSTSAGSGDADFSDGRDAGFDATASGVSTDSDRVSIAGETSVRYDGQLSLSGAELQQGDEEGGDFTLLGAGDRLQENVPDNTAGLVGTVRFVGSKKQTVEADETPNGEASPDTYFHGFAVNTEDEADVELASNVATNRATAPGLRPFGTVFLERGDIVTGEEDTLTVLEPTPTSGGDLVQAINADEANPLSDTTNVGASPVLGGTRNSHIVGTLQRAIEERPGSTGGFVSDGYIYPLGDGEQYSALVLELPTDLGSTQFFTTTIAENPGINLPDGLTSEAINPNTGEQFDLDLNTQSAPYFRVDFDEAPDEDFNVRAISGGLSGSVSAIKQMRLAQFDEGAGTAQEAGTYDFTGDPNDDFPFGPNSFISGVPNVVHEGVDFTEGNVIGFASDSEFNPAIEGDADVLALEGQVTYPTVENGSLVDGQPLENAEVQASSSDTTATTTTDGSGTFSFVGLPSGDYDVEVTSLDQPVENVSIGDAQRTVLGFAGIDPFVADFQETVADVNDSGTANGTDALLIARFDSELINGFEAGSYITESDTVSLENENADVTLRAAEAGDVNLSGGESEGSGSTLAATTLSPTKSSAATQSSSGPEGTVNAVAGKTFEVPVRIDQGAKVGSYKLSVEYDADAVTFKGIAGENQDVLTSASEEGNVSAAWFDRSGESALDLAGGSELVTLQFTAAEDAKGTEFTPEITGGEINGPNAEPLSAGVEVQGVSIGTPTPDKFALEGSYPNPVRSQATIEMDLPSRADVTIEVFNMLGQRVQTMKRTMSAGAGQTIQLDGSQFASGQYFYRVKAALEDGRAEETGRITVVK